MARSGAPKPTRPVALGAAGRPRRPTIPIAAIETLSGGNQQKVVMARWMRIGGDLLVLEDPTAGVDVGAKAEIYRLLRQVVPGRQIRPAGLDRLRGSRGDLPSRPRVPRWA